MRAWLPAIALLPALLATGCGLFDDGGTAPLVGTTPPPDRFETLIQLLDLSRPDLAETAALLATGDSLAAASALLAQFAADPPPSPPHQQEADPVAEAELLLAGRLQFDGHPEAALLEDPAWNEDPFGNGNWRFQYHTLRWLAPLLQAFQATGRRDCLDRLLFLLDDYFTDCLVLQPPGDMTWNDMAAAIRTEHLIYIWRELLLAGEMDVALMVRLLGAIQTHGDMLAAGIPYNGGSNHGSHHNRALLVAGLALPELRAAAGWFALSFARAEMQIQDMFHPDGVEVEQSPQYHFMMWGMMRNLRDILAARGITLSDGSLQLMEAMPRFAVHLIRPDQYGPPIGDSPLDLHAASFLGRDPELDFSISQGARGIRPGERFVSFPSSGWVILRSGWGERRPFALETHAVFDTGPRGGAHGHYDALTFTLLAFGKDLVVDSGYYTYDSNAWRRFFVSPAAHNILDGDGVPDAAWGGTPQRLAWRAGADWAMQSALLDLTADCAWIRSFLFLDPGDLLILDGVHGEDLLAPRLLVHFAPDCACEILDGGRLRARAGAVALDLWFLDAPPISLREGQSDPLQGWYSPAFGVMEANPVASIGGDGRREFATFLHPHQGDDALADFALLEVLPDQGLRFRIERTTSAEEITVWPASGHVERTPLR